MSRLVTHEPMVPDGGRRCTRDVVRDGGVTSCHLLPEEHLDHETARAVIQALKFEADVAREPRLDELLELAGLQWTCENLDHPTWTVPGDEPCDLCGRLQDEPVPSEDRPRGVVDGERDDDPSSETRAMATPSGSPRATSDDDVDASRDDARQATTDWKEVADMQHAFIVGMMVAAADMRGKSMKDAHRRADEMRDELVKEATK